METEPSRQQAIKSLRTFVNRRDEMLDEDISGFEHYLERFVEFCRSDPLVQHVLQPLFTEAVPPVADWWEQATQHRGRLSFPSDPDAELALRFNILDFVTTNTTNNILHFGMAHGRGTKMNEVREAFRSQIARPFAKDLGDRLGDAVNMATPEERDLQAVPLSRLPSLSESKIFLSHKTKDKPLVRLYFNALRQAGFTPWMDESDMPTGTVLERGLLQGFKESCAAVFFITENFKDENFLATEVEYARSQQRKKGKKFAIIILRYDNAPVPELLETIVHANIKNDLEGFTEILRALPIELGPIRWKAHVVD